MYRIQKGKKSIFVDKQKRPIRNKHDLERAQKLRIPPAWKKVVVSRDPTAKVQAIGLDEKARAQFIYSSEHKKIKSGQKFQRVSELGTRIKRILTSLRKIFKQTGYTKIKVGALLLVLISLTSLRVGNEINRRKYNTHGLSTLLKKHITLDDAKKEARFKFIGKKGVENSAKVKDVTIYNLLKGLRNRFKPKLNDHFFKYEGKDGKPYNITAGDINKLLKQFGPFTAKDFRTYNANLELVKALDKMPIPDGITKTKKNVTNAVRYVAAKLNNTDSVCRKEYCSPCIIQKYLDGPHLFKRLLERLSKDNTYKGYNPHQKMVIYLLK
jgi:DNA topoisomerase I